MGHFYVHKDSFDDNKMPFDYFNFIPLWVFREKRFKVISFFLLQCREFKELCDYKYLQFTHFGARSKRRRKISFLCLFSDERTFV